MSDETAQASHFGNPDGRSHDRAVRLPKNTHQNTCCDRGSSKRDTLTRRLTDSHRFAHNHTNSGSLNHAYPLPHVRLG